MSESVSGQGRPHCRATSADILVGGGAAVRWFRMKLVAPRARHTQIGAPRARRPAPPLASRVTHVSPPRDTNGLAVVARPLLFLPPLTGIADTTSSTQSTSVGHRSQSTVSSEPVRNRGARLGAERVSDARALPHGARPGSALPSRCRGRSCTSPPRWSWVTGWSPAPAGDSISPSAGTPRPPPSPGRCNPGSSR